MWRSCGSAGFPTDLSFEALDDKMQSGYELRKSGAVAACRAWLETWRDVLIILDKAGMQSIQEFDEPVPRDPVAV